QLLNEFGTKFSFLILGLLSELLRLLCRSAGAASLQPGGLLLCQCCSSGGFRFPFRPVSSSPQPGFLLSLQFCLLFAVGGGLTLLSLSDFLDALDCNQTCILGCLGCFSGHLHTAFFFPVGCINFGLL